MEENNELLKYIYHEDLFIVDEPAALANVEVDILTETTARPENETPTIVNETEPVTFFGHNEKGILILIYEPGSNLPKQQDLDFLMKIIESGLKYSKNDFALVNAATFPVDQILNEVPYNYLINFGVESLNNNDENSLYTIYQIAGKQKLLAESLSTLAGDESKKRQLWNALKSMFKL